MVKDLQERANDLPVHDVIAAIAGDSKAKSAINAEQTDPDPREFDRILPDNEFLVLDADSSQLENAVVMLAHSLLFASWAVVEKNIGVVFLFHSAVNYTPLSRRRDLPFPLRNFRLA